MGFDESLTAYNDLDFLIRVSQLCEIASLPPRLSRSSMSAMATDE